MSTYFLDCVNCGKQTIAVRGDTEPKCEWCHESAINILTTRTKPAQTHVVVNEQPDIISQPRLTRARERRTWYKEHRQAIIDFYKSHGELETLAQFDIQKSTWLARRKSGPHKGHLHGLAVSLGLVKDDYVRLVLPSTVVDVAEKIGYHAIRSAGSYGSGEEDVNVPTMSPDKDIPHRCKNCTIVQRLHDLSIRFNSYRDAIKDMNK